MVRAFRLYTVERVFDPLVAPLVEVSAEFRYRDRQLEGPLWTLLREQPEHLLDPRYESWQALLAEAADAVVERFWTGEGTLSRQTWGARNTVTIRHPLSRALPLLSRWIDIPATPLPGDSHMPRVQGVTYGASERFVVSPGREETGLFHMPGGQSGHPLSAHYRDGHEAWALGEPTPFLPGPTVHTLVLTPTDSLATPEE
jgi:penicillin amidase